MNILKVPAYLGVKSYKMRLMSYTLFTLIVADGILTEFLTRNGYASEANPFLQAWVGQESFLAIKISGAFLVILMLWIKYSAMPRLVFAITAVFLTFYAGIIFWNLFAFFISQT